MADYLLVNFTRTFGAIENPSCIESISIQTVDDTLAEADEQFSIVLTSDSFIVSISDNSSLITIENDDCKQILYQLLIDPLLSL